MTTLNDSDPNENVESQGSATATHPGRKRNFRMALALPAVALTAAAAFLMGTQMSTSGGTEVAAPVSTPSQTQPVQPADADVFTVPVEEPSAAATRTAEPAAAAEEPAPSASKSHVPEQSEPTGPSQAEMRWVDKVAGWIVDDVATTDEYVLDGIAVPSSLNLLADNFGRLVSSPAPPEVDEAEYYALAATLEETARDAADLYYDDPMTGRAKYEVLRGHTQELLDQITSWTGTSHRLPTR